MKTPAQRAAKKFAKGTIGYQQAWWAERKPKARLLRSGNWKDQHFCGSTDIMLYRGRVYCGNCGCLRRENLDGSK